MGGTGLPLGSCQCSWGMLRAAGGPLNPTCMAELQELEAEGQQQQAECEVVSPGD